MRQDEFWEALDLKGTITVASRMKRLSDLLFTQVQELYDARGRGFKSSWFGILATIRQEKQIDFKTIASRNNISAPAVSQLIKELEKHELVKIKTAEDKRSRLIQLTPKGSKALDEIIPDLVDIEALLQNLLGSRKEPLFEALAHMELQLRSEPLSKLLEIRVIRFDSKYTKDFEKLNLEWITEFFALEPCDREIFADPQKYILEKGGEIFLAIKGKQIIGTLALLPHDKSKLEMNKMTVAKDYRNRGVARMLLNKAIEHAKQNGYQELYALTNSKLEAAVNFYRKYGFVKSPYQDSRYQRVDEKYRLKISAL